MRKKTGKKQKKFSKKENFKLIKFNNKYLKTIYLWRNENSVVKNSLSKKNFLTKITKFGFKVNLK